MSKEIYVVLEGSMEHVLGWSDNVKVAADYCEEYSKIEGVDKNDIRVKKMKRSIAKDLRKKDGGFAFYSRELVCIGRGMYVPYCYRDVYGEDQDYLRAQYDCAKNFLDAMIKDDDFFSKKERKNFEATRIRMELYFRRNYRALRTDEQNDEIIDMAHPVKCLW